MDIQIKLPEKVKQIIHTLTEHGYEAYAVGGCVRDSILQRTPGDWDITTSAKPEQVKQLFNRTVDTGIEHGTVTVMLDKDGFEVTTYRIDGEYEDNRHPKNVEFTSDLIEDLKRRDFTINAMAYNEQSGLVDAFHGLEDIKKGVIRCVGDARERFDEDALRILRAIRFAAQLSFTISEETKEAIVEKAEHLKKISAERIRVELVKLIISDHPEKLITGYHLGITKVVLPEFDQMLTTTQNSIYHIYDVGNHSIQAVKEIKRLYMSNINRKKVDSELIILTFAMLLHDSGKPLTKTTDEQGKDHFYGHARQSAIIAKEVMNRLKFDNYSRDTVVELVKYHDYILFDDMIKLRKAISQIGVERFPLLLMVKRADAYAHAEQACKERLEALDRIEALYEIIKQKKHCLQLKDLNVTGKDLMEVGFKQGKMMGVILHQLLEIVLTDPEKNEKQILLQYAKKFYR